MLIHGTRNGGGTKKRENREEKYKGADGSDALQQPSKGKKGHFKQMSRGRRFGENTHTAQAFLHDKGLREKGKSSKRSKRVRKGHKGKKRCLVMV